VQTLQAPHGTTVLAVRFNDGVVIAGDRRATMGSRISNREMEKVVPESYEYHLCKWMIGGNNFTEIAHIKKCEELGVGRVEHLSDLIVYAEITGDKSKRNKYALEWFNSDENSPGMMYYNYNVLSGLKENAILLTNGDNDTYPAWILQAQGYRNDILVLNTSLMNIQTYRDSIFKIIGVQVPKKFTIQGDSDIVKLIIKNSKKIPVYLAVSINPDCTKPIDENLYLTGLAYEYSEESIDNLAVMRKNFEQNYLFDYVTRPLYKDISEYWTNLSNQNYALIPSTAGSPVGIIFSDTAFGCGQRWGSAGGINAPTEPPIPKPTGVCYITYYIKN
jgi:hypothetical protein